METVLFIGLGEYERALLSRITTEWKAVVMDIDEANLSDYQRDFPEIETISGDASSIITLRKVDYSQVVHIICSIRDRDVVWEICNMLRNHLQLNVPILIIHYDPIDLEQFENLHLEFFNPIEIGSSAIQNRMQHHLIRPTSIGKGMGELLQVTIKSASHLTARPLKSLRPSHWHVSMVYRDDLPLIPTGDLKLRVGDQVLLAGKPRVIENMANLLITGTPQFPLQFGSKLAYPLEGDQDHIQLEASFWLQKTRLEKVCYIPYHNRKPELDESNDFEYGPKIQLLSDLHGLDEDFGMIFVELKSLFKNSRLKSLFHQAKVPFLVTRHSYPYQQILVSLNTHQPGVALETGLEIARLTQLPLTVSFVSLPEELQYERDRQDVKDRASLVADFKAIFKMDFTYSHLTGNPVRETLHLLKSNPQSLLIVVSDSNGSTRLFTHNVAYLLSKRSSSSVLVIPGDRPDVQS